MNTRPADYVVFGTCLLVIPFLFGMGIGEDRALRDLSAKCLPQPGESHLLAVVQATKPEPSVTCIFEYSAPHKAVVKRKATRA
jgi:hypothetical protein